MDLITSIFPEGFFSVPATTRKLTVFLGAIAARFGCCYSIPSRPIRQNSAAKGPYSSVLLSREAGRVMVSKKERNAETLFKNEHSKNYTYECSGLS
ncbi:hypothetical protein [Paenibacillus sp. A14]|uniref:hypothetical protein n=1 Tax=Paenibacillus sp. A14 TaxID=3119820 RepID=UPI002FE09372